MGFKWFFSDSQPSVTVVFNGYQPLVQWCDGNDTSLQSTGLYSSVIWKECLSKWYSLTYINCLSSYGVADYTSTIYCWLYIHHLLLTICPIFVADMSTIYCWLYLHYLLLTICPLSIADYMSTMYCWLYVHYLNLAPSLFFWLSACTKDRKRRNAFNCWQTTITFKNRELLKLDLRYVKLVNSLKIGKTTATCAKNARHCGTYNDPLFPLASSN